MAQPRFVSKAAFVTLAMGGSLLGLTSTAFATPSTSPSTIQAPQVVGGIVEIKTPGELIYIDKHQGGPIQPGSSTSYLGATIELMTNIDLNGYSWSPFGTSSDLFRGTFNGQGYKISNFTVNTNYEAGFFGMTNNSTIENLGVDGSVTSTTTGEYAGLLVGNFSGTMTDCYSSGSVTGGYRLGGLVGNNGGSISDSYSTAAVSGGHSIGGLIGSEVGGSIDNSYAVGLVSASRVSNPQSGGIIGDYNEGSVKHTFFDTDTTKQSAGMGTPNLGGSTSVSDTNMKLASTFTAPPANWDFTNTWGINPSINNGYPYLRVFYPNGFQGQLPEVPFAGVLPFIGLATAGAFLLARKRRSKSLVG